MDDFELDFSKSNGYFVNCSLIAEDKGLLDVTRQLAKRLIQVDYMTVGEFFQYLPDESLKVLLHGSEMTDENPNMLDDILLIAMMLAGAEGASEIKDEHDAMKAVAQFTSFVALESLFRKGLIKLYRENMSFSDDLGNKIVAERAW